MARSGFKMRSGNSPLKDKDLEKGWNKAGYKQGGGLKKFFGAIVKDPTLIPKTVGKSLKHVWKKHGPVINPSTKNPRGIGK